MFMLKNSISVSVWCVINKERQNRIENTTEPRYCIYFRKRFSLINMFLKHYLIRSQLTRKMLTIKWYIFKIVQLHQSKNFFFKKVGKWVSLFCVGYAWVTVMDGVKFEFDDIKSLYKKNDSERRKSVSPWYCIDDIIVNKLIYI